MDTAPPRLFLVIWYHGYYISFIDEHHSIRHIFVLYHSNQSTCMYYMKGLYAKTAIRCTTVSISTIFQNKVWSYLWILNIPKFSTPNTLFYTTIIWVNFCSQFQQIFHNNQVIPKPFNSSIKTNEFFKLWISQNLQLDPKD